MPPTIVWFRQDLRLRDNPALHFAAQSGGAVIPVYVWSPEDEGDWPPGAASRWWLHQSLRALDTSLRERGSRLTLACGSPVEVLRGLAAAYGASTVCWNRRYEPAAIDTAARVREKLRASGIASASFNAALLAEPWDVLNRTGKPYRVYTPFKRKLLATVVPVRPLPMPRRLRAPRRWPKSIGLDSLELMPKIPWCSGFEQVWHPGERSAQVCLAKFLRRGIADYGAARDRPAARAVSRLSPYLHFGEIGPRQIWHRLGAGGRKSAFASELAWREFAHHLLYHYPHTTTEPLREEFRRFPWRTDVQLKRAWERGLTGVPLVDAGMRELWATGWMHNRVRMIVASFLVKNLLQPWQDGARWFWDTLVDADLANNTLNWQWVAGSGADAAPYFRVFNPVTQAERFDTDGSYIRSWVPELGDAPAAVVHAPWRSGGLPGYCAPIVSLVGSRTAAVEAYAAMRKTRS